jgi:hypothetical protein
MRNAMMLLRLLLLLLLATAVLGLTMALSTSETGILEKVVLLGLVGACICLAAAVPRFVDRVGARLTRS